MNRRHFIEQLSGLACVGATTVVAGGCALQHRDEHDGPHAPQASPLQVFPASALVLSSGGPRGYVHIGVLKALDELKLRPDLIAGASVGALIGALYSAGVSALELEQLALELQPTVLVRLAIGAKEPLSSTVIYGLMKRYCPLDNIEQTRIALAVAVAQRDTGKVELFTRGELAVAVQASAAIEGTFTPVRIRGLTYVDPDRFTPMPVRLVKALGASRVVSVDASAHENRAPPAAARFRPGDLLKRALTEPDARAASLNLHPDFGYFIDSSEAYRKRSIASGYEAAMARASELKTLFS